MNPETWIQKQLDQASLDGLERSIPVVSRAGGVGPDTGMRVLDFSSNDYLNLVHHPRLRDAARDALEKYGAGAGSSRLLCGTLPVHEELEAAIALLKGYPAALSFGSGFLANIGVITAMANRNDHVFTDRLAHASIIDATVQSRAKGHRFRHNNPDHLDSLLRKVKPPGRKLVVTESVFSMDGDLAPLPELAEVCSRHDAVLAVDEAHAIGIFGPIGGGRISEATLSRQVQLCVGTLSKALGSYGGFVACSNLMRRWLVNRARPVIYSTALPPSVAASALAAIQLLSAEPHRGKVVLKNSDALRRRLQEGGLNTLDSRSQIIPVLVGDNDRTLRISLQLREKGIIAAPIRPPTVPSGTARLRLSITYAYTEEELQEAAETIIRVVHES